MTQAKDSGDITQRPGAKDSGDLLSQAVDTTLKVVNHYALAISDDTGRLRMTIKTNGEIWIDPTGIEQVAAALVECYINIIHKPTVIRPETP